MNRRELLQQFGFCAAVAALPVGFFDESADEPLNLWFPGTPYVLAFKAYGIADVSAFGHCGLRRGADTLFYYGINEAGGMVSWLPAVGGEIYIPEGSPVSVYSSSRKIVAEALVVRDRSTLVLLSATGAEARL